MLETYPNIQLVVYGPHGVNLKWFLRQTYWQLVRCYQPYLAQRAAHFEKRSKQANENNATLESSHLVPDFTLVHHSHTHTISSSQTPLVPLTTQPLFQLLPIFVKFVNLCFKTYISSASDILLCVFNFFLRRRRYKNNNQPHFEC